MDAIKLNHEELMEKTKKMASQAIKIELPLEANFLQTDMNPFNSYRPLMGEVGELLLKYRRILLTDIDKIRSEGTMLKELDEKLGNEIKSN